MSSENEVEIYLQEIKSVFKDIANPENAKQQKKYMRNKFEFFGIKAQARRKATNKFIKKDRRLDYENIEVVIKRLWEMEEREYQYFATELLEKYITDFKAEIINLLEYMITKKSWWDTVDRIAKKLVGKYFELFLNKREQYLEKWVKSNNIWLQRTTLLYQLGYKEKTNINLLFDLIKRLKDIDQFFIQKAIGWSLREYSRIEPEVVKKFIQNHNLSSLSTREGMKTIKNKGLKK
ncbi:MAG: DNA alkylation repair protein [Halanaerobiales bacterium]|nr:DNA alkylation repair protein [Halanaerobiales bacterium]